MPNKRPTVFFVINLLQDLNVVRGLVYLTLRETEAQVAFLVSDYFFRRDTAGLWQSELGATAQETGAQIYRYGAPAETFAVLQGGHGMIIAASESNLNAHWPTAEVFRIAPPGYLRVTLQHGFECVGFKQSREHVIAHGRKITFTSDVVCGWFEPSALTSLTPSERSKIYVSGPPMLLLQRGRSPDHPADGGIVCENLHSVRLNASGDHKASFMDIFFDFCAKMAERGENVTLRPHPGGQYVIKNKVELPDNVSLNTLPMYHVNMSDYAYGISAPSTVVFDMVLAGIPTAVWTDPGGVMDAGNYGGLTEISTLDDWRAFERDVRLRPEMILDRQAAFLDALPMPTEPDEVYRRFARLLRAGTTRTMPQRGGPLTVNTAPEPARKEPRRVLLVSNGIIPTLELSFLKNLPALAEAGEVEYQVLTEVEVGEVYGKVIRSSAQKHFRERLEDFKPDVILCCRYSGPAWEVLLEYGEKNGAAVIYHIDDDLLNLPKELGLKKWIAHNRVRRREAVENLLEKADLRYCSTEKLEERLRLLNFFKPSVAGAIYCASKVLRPAQKGPVRRIGYMGFDHAADFEIALPALERYLEENDAVTFELFGSIPLPESLKRFGSRVVEVEPVRNYPAFLKKLASREWDIGICPLAQSPFNAVKANTKWVEYTASGMATIASAGLVYDTCAADGRGVLVDNDGWYEALQRLTDNPDERFEIASKAQAHLVDFYSEEKLRAQILDVLDTAIRLKSQTASTTKDGSLAGLKRLVDPAELLKQETVR